MPTNRNVIDFKIHNLTEEQFQELKDAGQIDPNALYCTPDETVMKFEELGERIDTANERIDTKQDVATAINYSHVTNCITEIPQDIKLELADGVLTLKAGSKIYVPNGADVFDVVTIAKDIVVGFASETQQFMLFYNMTADGVWYANLNEQRSGDTNPSDLYGFFYNTADNKVYYLRRTTTPDDANFSLPIAIITVSNGVASSIDQVFNGFGYIGSTVFALPGVKGLIPDGRNADGSLKSIEVAVNNVAINDTRQRGNDTGTLSIAGKISSWDTGSLFTDYYPAPATGSWWLVYDTKKNVYFQSDDGGAYFEVRRTPFGNWRKEGNKITNFTPKTTFHAVDYNDLTSTTAIAAPAGIVSAFAGKTAPSGWLKCDGSAVSRTRYATLFAAIGTLYGAGDGSTTFNLPNLIGRVPFGMDVQNVGQSTNGGLPNITGAFSIGGDFESASGAFSGSSTGFRGAENTGSDGGYVNFNASLSNGMYGNSWYNGTRVVPASVFMTYCIKY